MSKNKIFHWKGKEIITFGDISEAVSSIGTEKESAEFLELYSSVCNYALHNIGYIAGYYGPDTMARIHKLFKAKHPIFGTKTDIKPDEAIEAGIRKAKG